MKKSNNNEVLNTFIIEASLINPVKDILDKLENGSFRDCDIKWLNEKLEKYTLFACETLNIKIEYGMPIESGAIMNDYTTNRYIKYFKKLLNYFKSF